MVAITAPLPDIRRLFIPPKGYILVDLDLAGADARVVAWDAGDEDLKTAFKEGLKVHAKNALDLFGPEKAGPDGKKMPLYQENKIFVHATNYVGSAQTVSEEVGWPLALTAQAQQKWFNLHPAIPAWHRRINKQLLETGTTSNAFGFRIPYWGGTNELLPEATAWLGQSTVAIVCSKGLGQLRRSSNLSWVRRHLQVHDSLVLSYPEERHRDRHLIKEALQVTVPYDDPLIIPWGFKYSTTSWGELIEEPW